MEYQLRNLSKEFWQKVKVFAAKQGITIRQLIINLLTKEIEK